MQTENLVLRPNCLLTKAPLVFISGSRSLFAPCKLGADLQDFIAAHGYQITPLWMPFRSMKQRSIALQNWLTTHRSQKFHFIMAYETWIELQNIFIKFKNLCETITVIDQKAEIQLRDHSGFQFYHFHVEKINLSQVPFSYQIHLLFCFLFQSPSLKYEQTLLTKNPLIYDRFLDHCIDLAENE